MKNMSKKNRNKKKNISRKDRFYQGGVQLNPVFLERLQKEDDKEKDSNEKINFSDLSEIRAIAIEYFIHNSDITVLTNSSRNCVTLIAELKPDVIISPFQSLRFDQILDDNMNIDIRKILIKVLITRKKNQIDHLIQVKENLESTILKFKKKMVTASLNNLFESPFPNSKLNGK